MQTCAFLKLNDADIEKLNAEELAEYRAFRLTVPKCAFCDKKAVERRSELIPLNNSPDGWRLYEDMGDVYRCEDHYRYAKSLCEMSGIYMCDIPVTPLTMPEIERRSEIAVFSAGYAGYHRAEELF